MTNQVPAFLSGFAASMALIVAIGAQNLFVLRQGLRHEHVGPIVLFCAAADALLIILGVGGVGAALGAMPQLTALLACGGAIFLTWYGIIALRRMAVAQAVALNEAKGVTLPRALAAVAGFTFLNPHVYLDTVLLLGTLGSAQPPHLRPAFTIGAALSSLLWFTALGFGARLMKPIFTRPAAWRVLDFFVGIIMLMLAASLALHGLRRDA